MVTKRTSREFYEQDHWCRAPQIQNTLFQEYGAAELHFLADYLLPDAVILEVGCGTGRVLKSIVNRASYVHGIDFSRLMLRKAKQELGLGYNVDIQHAEAMHIPYKSDTFDYTLCMFNTYGNFDHPDKCLEEMLRVTKQGCEVIVSVYSQVAREMQKNIYPANGLTIEKDQEDAIYLREGLVSRRFSKEQLEEIAARHHLSADIRELTPVSYVAIFRK